MEEKERSMKIPELTMSINIDDESLQRLERLKTIVKDLDGAVQTIQVLSIKPGDVLVLNSPCTLSEAAYDRIKATYESELADMGCAKVVLLEGGMEMSVLRQGKAKPTDREAQG
jgi:DNA-binding Xre family transcriptional regulator